MAKQDYKTSRKISQYPRSPRVVDMELDCVFCKTRLYVSDTSFDAVLASLKRAGGTILVCFACGQAQLVCRKTPQSRYVHD